MVIVILIAGVLFFFSFFASLRSYVEYGSPWMMFFAALVQPLATAVLLTLLLSLYAKINPEIPNNDSVRQFYSTVRVFGFAALFLSSPLALLCAFGAIQGATFPLDSIARQAAFDRLVIRVTISVVGVAVLGTIILLLASLVS